MQFFSDVIVFYPSLCRFGSETLRFTNKLISLVFHYFYCSYTSYLFILVFFMTIKFDFTCLATKSNLQHFSSLCFTALFTHALKYI